MTYEFLRAACASPNLKVADCKFNADEIIKTVKDADSMGVRVLSLPELCITGYTCSDLFLQTTLLDSAKSQLLRIAHETEDTDLIFTVGLPLLVQGSLFNCAAILFKGSILAIIPKMNIPNYAEFYEMRHFSPASSKCQEEIFLDEKFDSVPFGTDILIEDKNSPEIKIAVEICEDLWVPLSPSTRAALSSATLILNPSASNETVGKAEYRRLLVQGQSSKSICAYLYADAGHDESSTDMIFSGHNIIALNGNVCAESALFDECGKILVTDLDMGRIEQDRLRIKSFRNNADAMLSDPYGDFRIITVSLKDNGFALGKSSAQSSIGFAAKKTTDEKSEYVLLAKIPEHPFVPSNKEKRGERCKSIIEMQAEGLAKRLRHTGIKNAVLGLSGGLDSTLALLVTVRAFDKCGLDRKNILCVTMPCFGTTDRTYNNACNLSKESGTSLKEIDIKEAVLVHFRDIAQDKDKHDVTYENCQARERTQVLMDLANQNGGLVIGTGDLSELALGWCTYNGDHMSMYGVNASIPKTLVRHLVAWFKDEAGTKGQKGLESTLADILDTPVSPELLPPDGKNISQKTEDLVGPYELHDFFIYYMLRWGYSPKKIFFLASKAFENRKEYPKEEILKWLRKFYQRFFRQQFKRSCMPDGAKVGSVSLSPRGDWRMPSDASEAIWISELDEIADSLGAK